MPFFSTVSVGCYKLKTKRKKTKEKKGAKGNGIKGKGEKKWFSLNISNDKPYEQGLICGLCLLLL